MAEDIYITGGDVDWATEKTQAQLLKAIQEGFKLDKTQSQKVSDTLKKIHKDGSVSAGKAKTAMSALTSDLKKLGSETAETAAGFDELEKGPLKSFGRALKESSGVFKGAMIGVGLLGTAIGKTIGAVQANVEVLSGLADSGVQFDGSFLDIQATLADTGMSLDQFSDISQRYTRVIARNGIREFSNLVTRVGEAAGGFNKFGLTTADATEYAAEYLEQQRMVGIFRQASEAEQNQKLKENIERLTAYSKALNVSRQEMQESTRAMLDRDDLQSMFFTMAPGEREKAQEAFKTVSEGFASLGAPGKRMLEMFTDMAASPIEENSESFRQLAMVAPEFAQEMLGMSRAMKEGRGVTQEELISMAERAGQNKELISSLRLAGGEIQQGAESIAILALAAEEARVSLAEHGGEFSKTVDKDVQAAANLEDAMNKARATIEYSMVKVFAELVGGKARDAVNAMADGLNFLTDKLRTYVDGPMTDGIAMFKETMSKFAGPVLDTIVRAVELIWKFAQGLKSKYDTAVEWTSNQFERLSRGGGTAQDYGKSLIRANPYGNAPGVKVRSQPAATTPPAPSTSSSPSSSSAPITVVVDEKAGREIGRAAAKELRRQDDLMR